MSGADDTPALIGGAQQKDLHTDDGKIVIRIGNVPLEQKIDAVSAVIDAIRKAHGDTMSAKAWAAMGKAQDALAEATLSINDRRPTELPAPIRRIRGIGR